MKLKLTDTKQEASDTVSFLFQPDEDLKWQAGQFLHYTLHHEPTDDRGSDRWFTISSAPHEDHVMITTRFTSEKGSSFKNALKNLKKGEEIEAEGPDGDFIVEDPQKDMVFIAGGIGITPYRSIFLDLDHNNKPINVNLLYSNRTDEVVFRKEFNELQKRHPEFKIHYLIGQRVDEETIRKYVPDLTSPLFYVSGPEPMVESIGDNLKKLGVPDDHIKQDFFPGYPED